MPLPDKLSRSWHRGLAQGRKVLSLRKEAAPAAAPPKLRVVRGVQDLSPEERAFLPHLLEIEETPPSPIQRKLLWTLLALVVIAIIWSILGQISVVSTAQGKFIPDGKVKQLQPMETAVVKAIHVVEGQHVKAGDLLMELDPAVAEAELDSARLKYQQNRLEQMRLLSELQGKAPGYGRADADAVALQEALREARQAAYQTRLNAAHAAVSEKDSAVGAAEALLRKAEVTVRIAQEREEKMNALLKSGFISRMEYLKHDEELQAAIHDLDAQRKTVEQQRHALRQAEEQLSTVQQDRRASILTELDKGLADQPGLKRDQDKAAWLHDLKSLRAPVDGYVQAVGVTTLGAVVTPAQNLVTIVPEGMPLIVEASLSNEDIGHVRVGQQVEIKVDTFPFQKYGTLKGTLVWVSPDAEEKGADSTDSQGLNGKASPDPKANKPAYSYKVHVKPERTSFVVDGKPTGIQSGMTVQADIATDRRRIIEFFLAPVIKYLDEGLRVR